MLSSQAQNVIPLSSVNTSQIKGWEKQLERISGVRKLEIADYAYLDATLKKYINLDSYAISAAYYLFTGRKGLWLYQNDNVAFVICWHPNIEAQFLVFSPIGKLTPEMVSLVGAMPVPTNGIRISRIHDTTYDHTVKNLAIINATKIKENVLDWVYPVHVLSTVAIKKRTGHGFKDVRKNLNRVNRKKLRVESLNYTNQKADLHNLIFNWSESHASFLANDEHLSNPHIRILEMSKNPNIPLEGLVYYYENKIQAFSIWERGNNQVNITTSLAGLSNTKVKGLSELIIVDMCETLYERNINMVSIGGSETLGLDLFKRKFCPIITIDMVTYQVTRKRLLQNSVANDQPVKHTG